MPGYGILGFSSKLRILPSVIPAQPETGGIDPPLKVLWLIKGLGAGGAERLLVQSARYRDPGLVNPGVAYLLAQKSTLVATLEEEGCRPVTCLDARSSYDPRWIVRLRRLLEAGNFDVLHIHSPLAAIGARLAVRSLPARRRPRIVVTEHNVWSSHAPLTRLADRAGAGRTETHLAVSAAVLDSLPTRIRARSRIVRYGVDGAEMRREAGNRADARARLGVADDEILIGTVANLRATKGYPDLLVAAKTVTQTVAAARFVAVGRGPLEHELRDQHARLGLGDRFRFLGYRPDAPAVMAAFDVFCLPSHYEGLPIAMMEALALGLPVVATRVGGVDELITDGEDAVLVPPHRPALLADALIALAQDPERRARMADLARARSETIDAPSSVRAVEAVYREVVGR
jgi:glycosyltransferase involved in cell wall biosynthesis